MRSIGEHESAAMAGGGYLGEVAQGPDGRLYQWVEGVDGLGNPVGFWKSLRKLGQRALKHALPLAQRFAPMIPGGAAALVALKHATPILRQTGLVGADGLGALYQAPDGQLFRMEGASPDELQGYVRSRELQGLYADDALAGIEADDELRGFEADDELRGFAEEELRGPEDASGAMAAPYEMQGVQSDLPEGVQGIEAFVPEQPATTPSFSDRGGAAVWKPLW